jgi:hypothetical protein
MNVRSVVGDGSITVGGSTKKRRLSPFVSTKGGPMVAFFVCIVQAGENSKDVQ